MTKGLILSLLVHLGLFYAGYNIYNYAAVIPVETEKFDVISVEIFSEKSSSPAADKIEEQLKIKLTPEVYHEEKSKPVKKEIKVNSQPEVFKNKKQTLSENKETLSTSENSNSSRSSDFNLISGNSAYNASSSNGEFKALYEQGIISKLERVKKYPERALVRRLEGEVLLYLELTAAGTIQDSAIKTSSGYSFFDTEVLSMVKRAGSFPKLSNLPETEKISYLIPISFKLT